MSKPQFTKKNINVIEYYSPIFNLWHLIKSVWPVHSVYSVREVEQ